MCECNLPDHRCNFGEWMLRSTTCRESCINPNWNTVGSPSERNITVVLTVILRRGQRSGPSAKCELISSWQIEWLPTSLVVRIDSNQPKIQILSSVHDCSRSMHPKLCWRLGELTMGLMKDWLACWASNSTSQTPQNDLSILQNMDRDQNWFSRCCYHRKVGNQHGRWYAVDGLRCVQRNLRTSPWCMPSFIMYLKCVPTNLFSDQRMRVASCRQKIRESQGGWDCRQAALREGRRCAGMLKNRAFMSKTTTTKYLWCRQHR